MWLDSDKIVAALRQVKAARDHIQLYHVGGDSVRLSVMTFRKTVENMYGLSIELWEVASRGERAGGNVERYADNTAIVMVRGHQDEDYQRFVTVKELCHLMNKEGDEWSTNGVETLRNLKVEWELCVENGIGHKAPNATLQSEYLAEIAAIALMYPCEYHDGDFAKLDAGTTSIEKLALEHGMPEWAIEMAFDHRELFKRFWAVAITDPGSPEEIEAIAKATDKAHSPKTSPDSTSE